MIKFSYAALLLLILMCNGDIGLEPGLVCLYCNESSKMFDASSF